MTFSIKNYLKQLLSFNYVVGAFLLGIILVIKIITSMDPSFGGDAQEHIYKIELLSQQIEQVHPSLWGRWDWGSYCGNPFLTVYNPLSYFPLSFLKILTGFTFNQLISSWILIIIPLSTIIAFFLALELTNDKKASFAGALVFSTLSWVTASVTAAGTLSHLMTFIFVPLTILFLERYFRKRSILYFIFTSISLAGVFVSHYRVAIYFSVSIFLFILIRIYLNRSRLDFISLILLPVAALLSGIFLIPAFYYASFLGGGFIRTTPILSTIDVLVKNFSFLIDYDAGLIPLIFQFLAVIIFFKFDTRKPRSYFPYFFIFIFFISWFFPARLIVNSLSSTGIKLDLISLDITTSLLYTTPVLSAYCFVKIKKSISFSVKSINRQKVCLELRDLLILTLLLSLLFSPLIIWSPLRYDDLTAAGTFLNRNAEYSPTLLFSEEFSDDLSNWIKIDRFDSDPGKWEIQNEECSGFTPTGESYLASEMEFDDFIYEVNFSRQSEGLFIGIIFNFFDENNTYLLRWKNEWEVLEFDKIINGTISRVARGFEYPIEIDSWHTLRVEAENSNYTIFIDNKKAYSVSDQSFKKGKIGFSVLNGKASFDDIMVYRNTVRDFKDWFRIWLWDRGPAQNMFGIISKLPMIDGYADTQAQSGIIYFLNKTFIEEIIKDTDGALNSLKIFNLKYIVLSKNPYVLQSLYNVQEVCASLSSSKLTTLVYSDSKVWIYELHNSYEIMASTNLFVILDDDQISAFYSVVKNETFSYYSGIFLNKKEISNDMRYNLWNGIYSNSSGYVDISVNNVQTKTMDITFNITADRDCFVSLPISFFPGLNMEIDRKPIEFFETLPSFVGLTFPKGTHEITVSRVITPLESFSQLISLSLIVSLFILLLFDFLKNKFTLSLKFFKKEKQIYQEHD